MSVTLESLTPCFQGLIPATFYTCSRSAEPNVALLSHVDYVDRNHVALSFQFFNKSRRNVAENPRALVRVYDPDTLRCWSLRLRFVRSETEGPVFDAMALRIEAIASHEGLKGIFRLRAADIYEVLSIESAPDEPGIPVPEDCPRRAAATADALFTMRALQEFSERIHRTCSLEALLDAVLETLEHQFGFANSIIVLTGEHPGRLVTIASRGYPESGVGSEVGIGEGIIGMVAEARKPIRISGMLREMLYAHAVAMRAQEQGIRAECAIPLPGLRQPESQLGIPLLAHGELIGVLCIESETPYRFHEQDKAFFELLGNYLAIAIQNTLLRERSEDAEEPAPPAAPAPAKSTKRLEATYYAADETVLVDGEYLVRSLPAKILWRLLREHATTGRTEFTNRELRLDKTLSLPEYKDNLESRLILLRRRLEQRCPEIRIDPAGRGRFVLALGAEIALSERA
ncbi:MAG TPA: GAF domain-containing protein [Candidatus Polarisedimenticolaceae bacterium]